MLINIFFDMKLEVFICKKSNFTVSTKVGALLKLAYLLRKTCYLVNYCKVLENTKTDESLDYCIPHYLVIPHN